MKVSDFYYELPKELIAQTPLADRAASRMLRLDRRTGGVTHGMFKDITGLLNKGDCLVINETKVIPARLHGKKENGVQAELLLLRRTEGKKWESLAKPGKKLRAGERIYFGDELSAVIAETLSDGNKIIELEYKGILEEILDKLGETPLPPYITERLDDKNRYQTVYAKYDGSAAAPTAGLHFTDETIAELKEKGVIFAKLTLHVGLGTFRPVKVLDVGDHIMHSEYYSLDEENSCLINGAKEAGGRVIAVGTTSCRTLETVADENGILRPSSGETDIFIYPGYEFKITDGLLTNFHLPESTLIMLISALAGREKVLAAYDEAVREKYRFFSFGDAMLII